REPERDRDRDQERNLAGDTPDHRGDAFALRTDAVPVRGRPGPGLLRPPGGAERAEIGAQRRGVPVEGVDRLQRAQRRVELRRVAIKRVERRLDALLPVALL